MGRRRFNRRTFLAASLASTALRAPLASALEQAATSAALPVALRDKLMQDPLRPQFHLLPRANWMNDPCAPRYFGGEYHMFFQYNPGGPLWGDMHWNHATSPDLIHWKHQPIAIAPTPGSFDAFGIFTGSVLPGVTIPTVLYTGVTRSSPEMETIRGEGLREVQCLATSSDPYLRTWTKLDKPVLDAPPPGLKVTGFRDPCPWKEGDTWYLGVGSGFAKVGGAVLLYRSADGRKWEYLHPLAQGTWNGGAMSNPVDTGEMWECPDFFPLGEKHVLLYSVERKVYWEVGVFGNKGEKPDLKFHSETRGMLDHGSYYAMKSMLDARGRRILWGWVEEARSDAELTAAGWAGCMALPRILTLGPDNELRMDVPPEFASLRHNPQSLQIKPRPQTKEARSTPQTNYLPAALATMPIEGRAGEIVCTFKPFDGACGLELRNDTLGPAIFTLKCEGAGRHENILKREAAGSGPIVKIGDKTLPLNPDHEGISTLHLWIDGSVIEVFLDSKEAITARCYTPTPGNIVAAWTGAAEALKSITVSNITPISADRLTS